MLTLDDGQGSFGGWQEGPVSAWPTWWEGQGVLHRHVVLSRLSGPSSPSIQTFCQSSTFGQHGPCLSTHSCLIQARAPDFQLGQSTVLSREPVPRMQPSPTRSESYPWILVTAVGEETVSLPLAEAERCHAQEDGSWVLPVGETKSHKQSTVKWVGQKEEPRQGGNFIPCPALLEPSCVALPFWWFGYFSTYLYSWKSIHFPIF